MEISAIVILLILAFISSFLSSSILNMSLEEVNKIREKKEKTGLKMQELKIRFEETVNPISLIELLFYIGSACTASIWVFQKWATVWYTIYPILGIFLIVISGRTLFRSFGARYAGSTAVFFLPVIEFLIALMVPVTFLLNKIQKLILKKSHFEVSREELKAMLESSHEEGSLDAEEYRILKNMMRFSTVLVSDVMTPRTVIFSYEADKKVEDVINLPEIKMYSRFPIWEGDSLDNGVIGYVMTKDVLYAALAGNSQRTLREFAREVYYIPENAELDKALERFLQRRQHLFVVVDEYGGVEGLLTMEDVMETILGVEIVDEADRVVDLRIYAKQKRDQRVASKLKKEKS